MELGFVAHYSPEVAAFAGAAGFDALELYVNRGGSLDLDRIGRDGIARAMDVLASRGLKVCTLTCSANNLAGDPATRAANVAYFSKALRACRSFGTTIMTTNTWGDPARSPAANLEDFGPVFSELARIAEGEGVRIAMENCPHLSSYPYAIGSVGYSPEMWEALFDAVPSAALGLEFDPSHLFWLGIDAPKAVRAFGDRILAFHAKDCEIDRAGLDRYGYLGRQLGSGGGSGWWRYRLPGLGQLDWKELFRALYDIDYRGPMVIEHEDPVFGGDRSEIELALGPKTEAGLRLGLRYLRSFMPA
jgi:sugar phosphate isomerase/epimerase